MPQYGDPGFDWVDTQRTTIYDQYLDQSASDIVNKYEAQQQATIDAATAEERGKPDVPVEELSPAESYSGENQYPRLFFSGVSINKPDLPDLPVGELYGPTPAESYSGAADETPLDTRNKKGFDIPGFVEDLIPETVEEGVALVATFAVGLIHPILGIGIALARLFNFMGGTTAFTSVAAAPPDPRDGPDTTEIVFDGIPRMNGFLESDKKPGLLTAEANPVVDFTEPTPGAIFSTGAAISGAPATAAVAVVGDDFAGVLAGAAVGYEVAEVPGALVGAVVGSKL